MVEIGDLIKYTGYRNAYTEFGVVIDKGIIDVPKVSEIPQQSIKEPYIVVMFFSRQSGCTNVNLLITDEGKTWFKID